MRFQVIDGTCNVLDPGVIQMEVTQDGDSILARLFIFDVPWEYSGRVEPDGDLHLTLDLPSGEQVESVVEGSFTVEGFTATETTHFPAVPELGLEECLLIRRWEGVRL